MRLGFALPQVGPVAGPEALVTVAQRAEALGFDSLWSLTVCFIQSILGRHIRRRETAFCLICTNAYWTRWRR